MAYKPEGRERAANGPNQNLYRSVEHKNRYSSVKDYKERSSQSKPEGWPIFGYEKQPEPSGYQDDGSYRLNTDISEDKANNEAARVSREQFERYMEDFAPQENALAGSLGDKTAEQAAEDAKKQSVRSREALERMRQRYGTSMTGQQQQAESRSNQRQATLGQLSAKNTGRQLDEQRNFNLKGSMLNIGNNISSSAMGGLTESAQNASARKTQYEQAKDQHSAQQKQQTASTIGTMATIAAMIW